MEGQTVKSLLDDACDILWELRGSLEDQQTQSQETDLGGLHEQTLQALSLIYRARKLSECQLAYPTKDIGAPQLQ